VKVRANVDSRYSSGVYPYVTGVIRGTEGPNGEELCRNNSPDQSRLQRRINDTRRSHSLNTQGTNWLRSANPASSPETEALTGPQPPAFAICARLTSRSPLIGFVS
jgi:hypothetical protein